MFSFFKNCSFSLKPHSTVNWRSDPVLHWSIRGLDFDNINNEIDHDARLGRCWSIGARSLCMPNGTLNNDGTLIWWMVDDDDGWWQDGWAHLISRIRAMRCAEREDCQDWWAASGRQWAGQGPELIWSNWWTDCFDLIGGLMVGDRTDQSRTGENATTMTISWCGLMRMMNDQIDSAAVIVFTAGHYR